MKGFLLGALCSFSLGTLACDFEFDRVELISENTQSFKLMRTVRDDEGEERTLQRVAIPLNEAVKQEFLRRANSGESLCVFGSYSPISPGQYFIFGVR